MNTTLPWSQLLGVRQCHMESHVNKSNTLQTFGSGTGKKGKPIPRIFLPVKIISIKSVVEMVPSR